MKMIKYVCGILLVSVFWLPVSAQTDLLDEAAQQSAAGDYRAALEIYDEYLLENPEDAEVYGFRALAHIALADLDAALTDIGTGIRYAEDEPELAARLLVLRAEFHVRAEDIPAALVDYDAALEYNPAYPLAYFNRALVHESVADYDAALADYTALIEIAGRAVRVTPYLRRAQIHLLLEDTEAALADYTTVIELEPDNAEVYILRGHLHAALEDWPDAAADYAEWLTQIESERQSHLDLTGNTTRRLSMDFGQIHELPFRAVVGQRLTVAATSRSVDSMVVVLDPDGTPIFADDDGGDGLNAQITNLALPATGEYTLIVGHARGGWDGTITLRFGLTEIL